MAVDTQTPAAVAPASGRKKKQTSTSKKATTTVADLIVGIVSASTERGGVSLVALKKALAEKGYDVTKNNARVKMVLRNLVTKGVLVRVKGTGASGSFKLNKKTEPKKAAKSGAKKATKSPARKRAPKDKKQSTKEKKTTAAKVTVKSKRDKKAGSRKNIEKPVKTSKPTKPGKSRSVKPKTVQVKSAKGRKTGPSKK